MVSSGRFISLWVRLFLYVQDVRQLGGQITHRCLGSGMVRRVETHLVKDKSKELYDLSVLFFVPCHLLCPSMLQGKPKGKYRTLTDRALHCDPTA